MLIFLLLFLVVFNHCLAAQAPIFLAEREVIIKIESLTVKSGSFYESAETFEGFLTWGL